MARGWLALFATGADQPEMADRGAIDRLYRKHRLRVMLAITLGYGLIYTCRLALGVVKKPIIDAGIFTPTELGLIGSALFYTYAIGKLTNGFLADHANIKRFLAFAFLATALCNLAMGFVTTVWVAVILWGLNGWFQSFGAPGGVVAMTAWFSNRERGRTYGIWSTAHSIGEGLTFLVVGATVATFGWRFGFWGPGMIGVITAIGAYWLLQDRPPTLGLPAVNDWKNDNFGEASKPKIASVLKLQLSILKMPAIWVLCLASATTYVTRYAINSWGVLYLQEIHGYSLTMAGTLLMISTLAGMVGAITFGFISDKLFDARRPPVNLIFALLELVGLCLFFYGPNHLWSLILAMVLFGMGLTGLVTSLGGLFAVDIAPKRVAGAAMGVIGICSYIGAGIQEQVSGMLIQHGMKMIDGVRHYNFGPAITFWIGSSVLSMLLALSLWRTRRRD
ncbi:sugar phosphate sensor protein [Rhodanobacter sp. Root480]|jgi:OPA family sugar phosphate sensor protein UhpC-like MFS transporter|uniref:MFS transporter n=1 Tax=unclassified Rhodanobacter TaxID=2621553 RepID=UPI0006F2DF3E|nr:MULTISPECIES: MFS transporter [unclassified Rhodanobacter]KQX97483.1 sugar phosphate sensor protein [Rhodanobacter sp. Root480]KRA33275.1 sugar phosphate sensor protein [Rhodanobacter sp. Root627]